MPPGQPPGGQLRLFFALWPEEHPLAAVRRIARDVAQARQGRQARDENFHVTMAFLGEVASLRLPRLEALGEDVANASPPFDLVFDRIGGNAHGIAWLSPARMPHELQTMYDGLFARLEASGFTTERRTFRPHVTLARHCSRPGRQRETPGVTWPVKRLSLIVSTLAPGGSRYEEIAGWPLRGGDVTSR